MQMEQVRSVRFLNAVAAATIIGEHPEAAVEAGAHLPDAVIDGIETAVRQAADYLKSHNGRVQGGEEVGKLAESFLREIAAPSIVPATVTADSSEPGAIKWKKIAKGPDREFTATFAGHQLRVVKLKPALYEGFVDGKQVTRGKFKRNIRERVEKEAAKLAA